MSVIIDPEKVDCHETGFRHTCAKHNKRCGKWVFAQGTNPQTGEPVVGYACADRLQYLLLVDLKKAIIERGVGTQEAVESLRNMVGAQNAELINIVRMAERQPAPAALVPDTRLPAEARTPRDRETSNLPPSQQRAGAVIDNPYRVDDGARG